jgi:NAD+-dependent protein deacetylase sirtuin 4
MQVAIEGVDYTMFKVPECPTCAIEGHMNSIVSMPPHDTSTHVMTPVHSKSLPSSSSANPFPKTSAIARKPPLPPSSTPPPHLTRALRLASSNHSYADIEHCDRLFLVGTTLATYSAFRLLKHALELRKPALMLNVGPTRADGLPGLEKIEVRSGEVMREVVRNVLCVAVPICRCASLVRWC